MPWNYTLKNGQNEKKKKVKSFILHIFYYNKKTFFETLMNLN